MKMQHAIVEERGISIGSMRTHVGNILVGHIKISSMWGGVCDVGDVVWFSNCVFIQCRVFKVCV